MAEIKTFTEYEREIVVLRAMINFIQCVLWQRPDTFLFCQALLDDVQCALDWCEKKIKRILAENPA